MPAVTVWGILNGFFLAAVRFKRLRVWYYQLNFWAEKWHVFGLL